MESKQTISDYLAGLKDGARYVHKTWMGFYNDVLRATHDTKNLKRLENKLNKRFDEVRQILHTEVSDLTDYGLGYVHGASEMNALWEDAYRNQADPESVNRIKDLLR